MMRPATLVTQLSQRCYNFIHSHLAQLTALPVTFPCASSLSAVQMGLKEASGFFVSGSTLEAANISFVPSIGMAAFTKSSSSAPPSFRPS